MNEETFQRKLTELIAEISTLPAGDRDKLELLAEQTRERHKQLKETVNSLQESIITDTIQHAHQSVRSLIGDDANRKRHRCFGIMADPKGLFAVRPSARCSVNGLKGLV